LSHAKFYGQYERVRWVTKVNPFIRTINLYANSPKFFDALKAVGYIASKSVPAINKQVVYLPTVSLTNEIRSIEAGRSVVEPGPGYGVLVVSGFVQTCNGDGATPPDAFNLVFVAVPLPTLLLG